MPSLKNVLPAAVCVVCLAAGSGVAGAKKDDSGGPTRADVRRYKEASAQLYDEGVYTFTKAANDNQAAAWYAWAYWNDVGERSGVAGGELPTPTPAGAETSGSPRSGG